jgi:hypothetical protein
MPIILIELGQQAGPNDRRFTGARASNDRDEMVAYQKPIKGEDLVIPAEEIFMVACEKRPQSGKWRACSPW